MTQQTANTLYTGGWDSTFRILYSLIVEKRSIRPHYIIDPDRLSTAQELQAMSQIKAECRKRFPATKQLLLPTYIYDMDDLEPDAELKAHEEALLKKSYFGTQYEWLARAVKQFSIDNAELCIDKMENHLTGCYKVVHQHLEKGINGTMIISDTMAGSPLYELFGLFDYPVIKLTKNDMAEIAQKHNFYDILEMSWFCHRPNILGQPCGFCSPCTQLMSKNAAHRIPLTGRICYHLKKNFDPRPILNKIMK